MAPPAPRLLGSRGRFTPERPHCAGVASRGAWCELLCGWQKSRCSARPLVGYAAGRRAGPAVVHLGPFLHRRRVFPRLLLAPQRGAWLRRLGRAARTSVVVLRAAVRLRL